MAKYNIQIQDYKGDIYYPLTNSKNIIYEDNTTLEDQLNLLKNSIATHTHTKNDAGFYNPPKLVFVGEDIQHTAEMFRIIKKVSNYLKDEDMYFTTELKHLDEDLTKSISVFELDKETKKYKAVIKELDILKPGEKKDDESKLKLDMKFNSNMIVE